MSILNYAHLYFNQSGKRPDAGESDESGATRPAPSESIVRSIRCELSAPQPNEMEPLPVASYFTNATSPITYLSEKDVSRMFRTTSGDMEASPPNSPWRSVDEDGSAARGVHRDEDAVFDDCETMQGDKTNSNRPTNSSK